MRRRSRRWWRWGIWAAVLLVIGLGTAGWLMFQHIPSWYRPVVVPPDQLQRVRNDVMGTFDQLSGALVHESQPFDHRFTQEQINAWLSARVGLWPRSREWLPPELTEPCVAIGPDGIRVAATYRHGGIRTVISAWVTAEARDNAVRIELVRVAGGALPVPRQWLREELAELDADVWPGGRTLGSQYGREPMPRLTDLLNGARFPAAWIWQNGKQPFRIIGLRFEPGALVVTLEPIRDRQSSRRSSHASPLSPRRVSTNVPRRRDPVSRTVHVPGPRSSIS